MMSRCDGAGRCDGMRSELLYSETGALRDPTDCSQVEKDGPLEMASCPKGGVGLGLQSGPATMMSPDGKDNSLTTGFFVLPMHRPACCE